MPQVASSALAVPHSRIREIADIAMRMDNVLRLYFGESNLPTPAFIKEAAERALAEGFTYYTENAGLPSLRRAIARKYAELHGVEIDPLAEVVVTASGVQALQVGIRCALDPGDEAIVLTPAWQNQLSIPAMCNATPRMVPLALVDGAYRIDFDALHRALTPRTRLLIYTSPSNPLGWVATVEEQRQLLEFTRRHGLWLLADEVYERLWYPDHLPLGAPAPSILRLATRDDSVLVVQSFSKAYCMTGWRVGWLVARRDLADRATKLNEFIISSAPAFAQRAAEAALAAGEPAIAGMLAQYRASQTSLPALAVTTAASPRCSVRLYFVSGFRFHIRPTPYKMKNPDAITTTMSNLFIVILPINPSNRIHRILAPPPASSTSRPRCPRRG